MNFVVMKIELKPDLGEEAIKQFQEIIKGIDRMNEELDKRKKKILELEDKLKQFTQNGS
jgi:hypothetical protein